MTEQQKVKKYKELVKNLFDQFYTKENVKKMRETIANRESFRKEYSRGGVTMPRGYYSPSLISEIIVTNRKRGRLLKKLPAGRADYCYYFSGDRIVLVQKFHEDMTFVNLNG